MLEMILKASVDGTIFIDEMISTKETTLDTHKLITIHISISQNTPGLMRTKEDKILLVCPIELCTREDDRTTFMRSEALDSFIKHELVEMRLISIGYPESGKVTILNVLEGDQTVKKDNGGWQRKVRQAHSSRAYHRSRN